MHDGSITLLCQNDLAAVEGLQLMVTRFCDLHGISGKYHHAFNLAMDEVLTNVIRHGYTDQAPHEIRIHLELTGNELSAEIEDDGQEFSPVNFPVVDCSKPLSERKLGGLGIHLVRSLVSRMDYHREHGKNVLTLSKRVR